VERLPVVIVGGGQAGLAVSWHLARDGIEHAVLERDTLVHSWRDQRWDSFCLVTPNWQCRLPGYHYDGADPHGFMVAVEIHCLARRLHRELRPARSRAHRGLVGASRRRWVRRRGRRRDHPGRAGRRRHPVAITARPCRASPNACRPA